MRVRGLKQLLKYYTLVYDFVAPHAGAWIETSNIDINEEVNSSHPMRVRGLKPC